MNIEDSQQTPKNPTKPEDIQEKENAVNQTEAAAASQTKNTANNDVIRSTPDTTSSETTKPEQPKPKTKSSQPKIDRPKTIADSEEPANELQANLTGSGSSFVPKKKEAAQPAEVTDSNQQQTEPNSETPPPQKSTKKLKRHAGGTSPVKNMALFLMPLLLVVVGSTAAILVSQKQTQQEGPVAPNVPQSQPSADIIPEVPSRDCMLTFVVREDISCPSGQTEVILDDFSTARSQQQEINAPEGELFTSGTISEVYAGGDLGTELETFTISIDSEQVGNTFLTETSSLFDDSACILHQVNSDAISIENQVMDKDSFNFSVEVSEQVEEPFCGDSPAKVIACLDMSSQVPASCEEEAQFEVERTDDGFSVTTSASIPYANVELRIYDDSGNMSSAQNPESGEQEGLYIWRWNIERHLHTVDRIEFYIDVQTPGGDGLLCGTYQPEIAPTNTPTPSPSPTGTLTPTSTPTNTPTPSPSPTGTLTPTPTATNTPTPEPDATSTPEPTNTPEPDATSTPEPTATPEAETHVVDTTAECNEPCTNDSDCENESHICYNGRCRLDINPEDEQCRTPQGETTVQRLVEQPVSGPEDWLTYLKAGIGAVGAGLLLLLLL